jgi:hypothetical protein
VKRAHSMLKDQPHYRADAVRLGLKRLGYTLVPDTNSADLLVVWNRYGWRDIAAKAVESRGGKVIVMENGYLGNDFLGDRWYAAAISQHNGAGEWPVHGNDRWDSLGVDLRPWRIGTEPPVILPQRGIGPAGIAMPLGWTQGIMQSLQKRGIKHRLRPHPGMQTIQKDLVQDISACQSVITWGSGAAIKALSFGVPVFYSFDKWIGALAARPFAKYESGPVTDDFMRLEMFRRLAWAMWRVSEIESGFAFDTLLKG